MKKQTFADRAKTIMNKYKRRLGENFDKGDLLALEAMNQELSSLREEQELERSKMNLKEGNSGLPMHPGDTTDGSWLGKFKQQGTVLDFTMQDTLTPYPKRSLVDSGFVNDFRINLGNRKLGELNLTKIPNLSGTMTGGSGRGGSGAGIPRPNDTISGGGMAKLPSLSNMKGMNGLASVNPTNNTEADINSHLENFQGQEGEPFKSRVPWMGMASEIVGNLLMNRKIDLPEYQYEEYKPGQVSPNLVNYGREREQVMRERDIANQMIMGAARGTGSQASLMENIQAGATGTQRAAGEQFGRSLETEGNVNAQIMNEAQQLNEANRQRAAEMNNRNKMFATELERENAMIDADRRDARTSGIMGAITGYGRDLMAADQYDTMLHMAAPENTRWSIGEDSTFRKIFGISPRIRKDFFNTNDVTSEPKKEKGGQLSSIQLFGDEEYERLMMRTNRNKTKK